MTVIDCAVSSRSRRRFGAAVEWGDAANAANAADWSASGL
jgi:hypothetical protein